MYQQNLHTSMMYGYTKLNDISTCSTSCRSDYLFSIIIVSFSVSSAAEAGHRAQRTAAGCDTPQAVCAPPTEISPAREGGEAT